MLSNQRGGNKTPATVESIALDFLRSAEQIEGKAALCDAFQGLLRSLGFRSVLAARLPSSGQIAESAILLNTFPETWSKEYLSTGFLQADPVLAEMLKRYKAVAWADVVDARELTAIERSIFHLAVRHGFDCGYAVPMFELSGHNGFVSVAGTSVEISDVVRWAVDQAATQFYHRICALERRRVPADVQLTDREIEVLRWIATGKSDWQIGQILDISAKTVNYHVENVKRKFDVATRMQAVVKAIRLGKLPE